MSDLSVTARETSRSLAAIVASVDPTLAAARDQTSPDGMMTIVFTDIEGSTEMMERLGELDFIELIQAHDRLVRDCVADHNGEVVKSQGDGFMIVFASSAAALRCAVALQRRLDEENEQRADDPIRVRIGMHTGNIFAADRDFLGRAVVLAARITGRARGGEILVSDDCKRYTDRLGTWCYGDASQLQLKGLSTPTTVHPLDWT